MASQQKFIVIITSILIITLCYAKPINETHNDNSSIHNNNEEWDLRHAIPGEPEIDYPIYAYPIKTNFNCEGRHQGYYADVETRCQLFRICTNTDLTGEGFAFLCPNGTLFSQRYFICDWYRNVDCNESENYYFKNEEIGNVFDHDELMETAKEMVEYPMKNKSISIRNTTAPSSTNNNGNTNLSNNKNNRNINNNSPLDNNQIINIRLNSNNDNSSPTTSKSTNTNNNSNSKLSSPTTITRTNNKNNSQLKKNSDDDNQNNNNKLENVKLLPSIINDRNINAKTATTNKISLLQQPLITTTSSTTATTNNRGNINAANGSQRLRNQEKVYVNSLGELSTDVGTSFDPNTALILDKSNGNRRNIKKSLDDVLGDSVAYRNHLENENRRKDHLEQAKAAPVLKNSSAKKNPSKTFDDHIREQSRMKLTFAEKVNAGLNDIMILPNINNNNNNNSTLINRNSSRNLIFRQKLNENSPRQSESTVNGNFINLADNINTGLFHNQHKLQSSISVASSLYDSTSVLPPNSAVKSTVKSTVTKVTNNNNGHKFEGYETNVPKPITTNLRHGRQFQFPGSAFTSNRQDSKSQLNIQSTSHSSSNAYLPPKPDPSHPHRPSIGNQTLSEIDRLTTNLETLKNLLNGQNQFESNTNYLNNLLNIEHNNNTETMKENNYVRSNEKQQDHNQIDDDIHVKKRAEELLLQGVHQTIYETEKVNNDEKNHSSQIDNNNNYDRIQLTINSGYNALPYEPMIIRVYGNTDYDGVEEDATTEDNNSVNNLINETTSNTNSSLIKSPVPVPVILNNKSTEQVTTVLETVPTTLTTPLTTLTPPPSPSPTPPTTPISVITENPIEITTLTTSTEQIVTTTQQTNNNTTTELNLSINKFKNTTNNIIARRQTAKPILYSKKPYTVRNYPKTSTTTIKPNKYLVGIGNRRNRFRNRLTLKENGTDSSIITTTSTFGRNQEQQQNDLTAVANTYGTISNKYKYNLLKRTRPTYNSLRNKTTTITTTISPLLSIYSSDFNLPSISQFVPLGQHKFNHDLIKDDDINLQKLFNYQTGQQHTSSSSYGIGNQQPALNPLRPPLLTKSSSVSYTEIPGTNIKISKSNEEATFILSSDPRQLAQYRTPAPTTSSQRNGYVPLNEYITNTLNGQIRNLAGQTTQVSNINNNPISTTTTAQSSQGLNHAIFSNTSPQQVAAINSNYNNILHPVTNVVTYQNQYQPSSHQNYGYNIIQTTTSNPSYHQQPQINHYNNNNNINSLFSSSGTAVNNNPQTNSYQQQQQQQHLESIFQQNTYKLPNKQLTSIFGNTESSLLAVTTTQSSIIPPVPTTPQHKINIYNNLSDAVRILPQIHNLQNQFNRNQHNNLATGPVPSYPSFSDNLYSQQSNAERRLDIVEEDDEKESLYFKGISSYHVPIGSIGRLANDRLVKRSKK